MRKLLTIVVLVSGLAGVTYGQTPQDAPLTFEVASVRPNKSGSPNNNFSIKGDTFTATNTTLRELIRVAYEAREMELTKGQEWIESERIDIVAKARAQLKPGRFPDELKPLLAERFGLKVHNESREVPIYELLIARPDGKLGAGLRSVAADRCAESAAQTMERARKGLPPPAPIPGQRLQCGMQISPGVLQGASIGLGPLVNRLSSLAGRQVVDRTGLTGAFDFDLTWAPDAGPDAVGPSIFTALQEQLGLKLESTRGPINVLVIDEVRSLIPN
jgi:uncharacterized protein (TIGR03435 family)